MHLFRTQHEKQRYNIAIVNASISNRLHFSFNFDIKSKFVAQELSQTTQIALCKEFTKLPFGGSPLQEHYWKMSLVSAKTNYQFINLKRIINWVDEQRDLQKLESMGLNLTAIFLILVRELCSLANEAGAFRIQSSI